MDHIAEPGKYVEALQTENAKLRDELRLAGEANGRLRYEVELLQNAVDKSNVALADAIKTVEERNRWKQMHAVASDKEQLLLLQIDELKRNHKAGVIDPLVSAANKAAVEAMQERDNLLRLNGELIERCAKIAEDKENWAYPDGRAKMTALKIAQEIRKQTEKRSVSGPKEWAVCGWCAGGHDDPQGTCPKCHGAKGKWIEATQ